MTEMSQSGPAADLASVRELVYEVAAVVRRVTGDPSFNVRLFGSWASGNPRPHSDIDIAIDGPRPVDPAHMADIRDACDRLPTLFTIDLVDLAAVSPSFRQNVRAEFRQFWQALSRFEEGLALPVDPVVRDACIQRFEFTFETAWKAIQADASAEGLECTSPRDCFRTAFRMGILDLQETSWLKMVEDRNRTSHTYDEETAEEIYRSLRGYAQLFGALLGKHRDRAQQRQLEEHPDEGTPRQ